MAETRMMKVEEEVKLRIEELKAKFSARSESEVVKRLLEYHDKRNLHIELPEGTMSNVRKTKDYLKVSNEAAVVEITQHYFDLALSYPLTVFEKIQQHQRLSRW